MPRPQLTNSSDDRAGAYYVCAELSKRGVINALLPDNSPNDDILLGSNEGGERSGYIKVKVCHPDRSETFMLRTLEAAWDAEGSNKFCVFVWLGATWNNKSPRYWVAYKREVSDLCIAHSATKTHHWERRFNPADLPQNWENRWSLFEMYGAVSAMFQDA